MSGIDNVFVSLLNSRFRPAVWDGKSAVTEFVTAIRVARCMRGNGRKAN